MTHVLRCDTCGGLTFDRHNGCPDCPACDICADPATRRPDTDSTFCDAHQAEADAADDGERAYEAGIDEQIGAY